MSKLVVHFESDGGFAAIPGLNRPLTVDADELNPTDRERLRSLLDRAGFGTGTAARPAPTGGSGGADQRSYTITVTEDGQTRTVKLRDPVTDPELAALVSQLTSWQRTRR
jgi:hypothetical protein